MAPRKFGTRAVVRALDERPPEDLRWELVEDFGRIRWRTHRGRRGPYLDFRPLGRVYSDRGTSFDSEQDAQRTLTRIRSKIASGRDPKAVLSEYQSKTSKSFRIESRLADWVQRQEERVSAQELSPTYVRELKRYASNNGYFSWWTGKLPSEICFASLEDWIRWLSTLEVRTRQGVSAGKTLNPNTRRKALDAFRTFVRWLHKRGEIENLPAFPTIRTEPYEPTIISIETQQAILEAIPWERRGAFLAAACGVRPGEVRALNIEDVVQEGEHLWLKIRAAMQGPNSVEAAPRTKTRKHGRAPVSEELAKWIYWRIDQVGPQDRLKGAIPLFINPTARNPEKRWLDNPLREEWNRATKRLGLVVKFYEGTKHATATDAIQRGVSLQTVQKALRHGDSRSTERYAKIADHAPLDLLRNPAVVPRLSPMENRSENTNEVDELWRGGRDSNPQLLA